MKEREGEFCKAPKSAAEVKKRRDRIAERYETQI